MRIVVLLSPGPAWAAGAPVTGQDPSVIGAHLQAMRRRYDEGALLFGGPYTAAFGGVALLEVPDLDAARALMDTDPAVAAGVMVFQLFPVRPFFDAFAGRAWTPPAAAGSASGATLGTPP